MRAPLATLLIFGMTVLAAAAAAENRDWLTSVDEALELAQEKDQPVLVDLYAEWCGWCKRLEEDVFSTPLFEEFVEDYVLLRVDTEDGGEGTRLQQRFKAYSLPTTLVLDHRQTLIAEVQGYAPAAQYVATIEREIASFDELIRGYERFKESDDPRVLGILADEWHKRNDGDRAATLYRQLIALGNLTADQMLRTRYQLVDALRIATRYGQAMTELSAARDQAAQMNETALVQRFDLMAAQVSLDRGDCDTARVTLEAFLGTYPASDLSKAAKRTLRDLDAEGYRCV